MAHPDPSTDILVKDFRQILHWPLQLMPLKDDAQIQNHWEALHEPDGTCQWRPLKGEFNGDPKKFSERYYREFATFLPYVQRLLYGDFVSGGKDSDYGRSPIRVFRRADIKRVRAKLIGQSEPLLLDVIHADLYFFHDVDVVILSLEIGAHDLTLTQAQNIMYHFGRAYPSGWNAQGVADHCFERVEWLGENDAVLAVSDYEMRQKFIESVCAHQVEHIAAHWEFLLRPMSPSQNAAPAPIRYRQLEYYRMPLMAYLAVAEPARLTRDDYKRLTFVGAPGQAVPSAAGIETAGDFERQYCYDRFFHPENAKDRASTRIMCSGYAMVAVGDASKSVFTDSERGFHAQFRHQIKLLGVLAHLHKAALLMVSDRVVSTMARLEIDKQETVARFRRDIRYTLEIFLRFTHRYWFSDVSEQALARDLFKMWSGHLGTERLYKELREEIHDMSQYLESDMLSRQAVTILQLTVVTLLSLIGTVTTGFLGMNIFAFGEGSPVDRTIMFFAVFAATTALTFFTVLKSRRLAVFLDTVSSEETSWAQRFKAFINVWRRKIRY